MLYWPTCALNPKETHANPVPFTRGGGRSLNGIERVTRTDKGFWSIELTGIVVRHGTGSARAWNALRTGLNGRAGLIVVPAKSWDTAPYASGRFEPRVRTVHDDGTPFSDGTTYSQGAIDIEMAAQAAIGSSVVTLRRLMAADDLSGIRFSYQHALYETGPALEVDGELWTVPLFPSIRATIPAGASLECDQPTCLVRLAEDRGMDLPQGKRGFSEASVAFVEAVDHWNDLARA
jgi:hypothetical protein